MPPFPVYGIMPKRNSMCQRKRGRFTQATGMSYGRVLVAGVRALAAAEKDGEGRNPVTEAVEELDGYLKSAAEQARRILAGYMSVADGRAERAEGDALAQRMRADDALSALEGCKAELALEREGRREAEKRIDAMAGKLEDAVAARDEAVKAQDAAARAAADAEGRAKAVVAEARATVAESEMRAQAAESEAGSLRERVAALEERLAAKSEEVNRLESTLERERASLSERIADLKSDRDYRAALVEELKAANDELKAACEGKDRSDGGQDDMAGE